MTRREFVKRVFGAYPAFNWAWRVGGIQPDPFQADHRVVMVGNANGVSYAAAAPFVIYFRLGGGISTSVAAPNSLPFACVLEDFALGFDAASPYSFAPDSVSLIFDGYQKAPWTGFFTTTYIYTSFSNGLITARPALTLPLGARLYVRLETNDDNGNGFGPALPAMWKFAATFRVKFH